MYILWDHRLKKTFRSIRYQTRLVTRVQTNLELRLHILWNRFVGHIFTYLLLPDFILCSEYSINPFLPNIPFLSLWKHQKTKGFLMFSGGTKGNIGKKRVKIVNYFTLLIKLTHSFSMHHFCIPWKHKTLRLSDTFRRCRKGALGTNGLRG